MKRAWLIAVLAMVAVTLATVAWGQEFVAGSPWEPTVTGARLLSHGEATCIVIYVYTPYREMIYDLRWAVFNKNWERVRHGGTNGWDISPPGDNHFPFEQSMEKLNGEGYYVRAWIKKYAPLVDNER